MDCREILRGEHFMKIYGENPDFVDIGTLHKNLTVPHIIVSDVRVYSAATKTTHCYVSMATVISRTRNVITLYVHCLSFCK